MSSMERWKGNVAVVTGASSGIGAEIARSLVESGLKVVGVARRKEKIEELANSLLSSSGKLYALKADITKEVDIVNAFCWISKNVGPVHILINSAGIGKFKSILKSDTQYWKEAFDTNVIGLGIATREAVKVMLENNIDGHILHINSIVAHDNSRFAAPNISIYVASKHAVSSLTDSIRAELHLMGSKIKVSSVSPGYVNTEFVENVFKDESMEIRLKYQELLKTLPQLQTKDIADAVLHILATPPHVEISELIISPLRTV